MVGYLRDLYRWRSWFHAPRRQRPQALLLWQSLGALTLVFLLASESALAVTPETPEVRKLIESGLKYLEQSSEGRLGGQCLIGLAFLKDGASPDHPLIQRAVEKCKTVAAQNASNTDVYSNGLAIIFLVELDARKHRELISSYAGAMAHRQKKHGGWGYEKFRTGDTSQTQYAALSYWELMRAGAPPSVESVERCLNWLLRTQDPSGTWGYQGQDPGDYKLVEQRKTGQSMLAAGLGSTMILGNMLGILKPGRGVEVTDSPPEEAPPGLQVANQAAKKKVITLSGNGVEAQRVTEAVQRGQQWIQQNFRAKLDSYPYYYLYSTERYKSFEELLTGDAPEEPDWYQQGYEVLRSTQREDGSWHSSAGEPCATAFAVLFLVRSTQKSIRASLGQGTLVGGRGLPSDLSNVQLRGGRLVVAQKKTEIDELLGMLEESSGDEIEALLDNPQAISFTSVGPEQARRLQQMVRSSSAESRLLAVRTLGRLRDLDHVPTLLYAMTDPDNRVVRAARDALRLVSRQFGGFSLEDNFTDRQRYDALENWKQWYRKIRPDAPLLP